MMQQRLRKEMGLHWRLPLHSGNACKIDLARRMRLFFKMKYISDFAVLLLMRHREASSNGEPFPSMIGNVAAPSSPMHLWVSPYTRQSYREQFQRSVGGVCATTLLHPRCSS
jgi:hypothetical protein